MLKKKLIDLLVKWKSLNPIKMARYARENTEFYQSFYQHYDMSDFDNLPVLTKYDFIDTSPYAFLSTKAAAKAFLYAETSGSSGASTPSFFTPKDFHGLIALSMLTPFMQTIKANLKENRVAVNGLTFGYTIAGFSFGALLQMRGALVAQLGSRSSIAMPERTAKTIVKLMPGLIASTPLDFLSWMEIIRTDYPDKYDEVCRNIKFLMTTAEPCAKSRQLQIEKQFRLTQVNTYASVDGFVSIPCPCGEMHIADNLHYTELYDANKQRIGELGKGRLCFTNLLRRTTPMVKFLIDDLVTIKESNCKHGFKKSVLPHGRYELSLELKGETWGNLDFEEVIYKYGLFMDYRVEVNDNSISVLLEEYPVAIKEYDLIGLRKELTGCTGMECNVALYPMGELTNIRKVREAKSVIKVIDKREDSRQRMPDVL